MPDSGAIKKDKDVFKEFTVQHREKQTKDDLQWARAMGQENSLWL